MYIPTWIIVLGIIVAIYYFSVKRYKKNTISSVLQTKEPTIEDLSDEQKEMLNHLSNYRKRTGKQTPTYEEMLSLNQDEFQTWMIIRTQKENREALLNEMIEHEEETGSFAKTLKPTHKPHEKLIVDVFKKEKSKEVVEALEDLFKVAYENDTETKDEDKDRDIIRDSIYAKSTSDYFKLGEKMEKERNVK